MLVWSRGLGMFRNLPTHPDPHPHLHLHLHLHLHPPSPSPSPSPSLTQHLRHHAVPASRHSPSALVRAFTAVAIACRCRHFTSVVVVLCRIFHSWHLEFEATFEHAVASLRSRSLCLQNTRYRYTSTAQYPPTALARSLAQCLPSTPRRRRSSCAIRSTHDTFTFAAHDNLVLPSGRTVAATRTLLLSGEDVGAPLIHRG